MNQRYPAYEEADIVIESGHESPDVTVNQAIIALKTFVSSASFNEANT